MEQLSIIICSRKKYLDKDLLENIEKTVGCRYELIVIDNSSNQYSIFQAYNIGIERSKYKYLCFIHDDVFFNTKNWGKRVLDLFEQNPKMGLLGIAGGKNKAKMPSAWWDAGSNHYKIIQHFENKPKEHRDKGFLKENLVEVAGIDGVFMVMKADNRIQFDETLKGFHNYDLYLSLAHKRLKKKVMVTNEILIDHYSPGVINKSWYLSTSIFHKIYAHELPCFLDQTLSKGSVKEIEFRVGLNFINGLLENKLRTEALYWWFKLFKLKPRSKYHFLFLRKLLNNQILGGKKCFLGFC